MDDFCIWVENILRWVDRTGTPTIPWIGQAGGRVLNPPAPHLEFIYAVEGTWDNILVGERTVRFVQGRVSLHNVHQGNSGPPPQSGRGLAWCCFFDVKGVAEFAALEKTSLFCSVPVADGARLVAAFAELQKRCLTFLGPQGHYLGGSSAYDPQRGARLSPASRAAIKAACLDLLAALLWEGELSHGGQPSLPGAVRQAIEFMSVNSRDPEIGLDDVARAAGLSVDHFGRLFRSVMRTTPIRYLQAIRIEHSRFLLTHSRLRVDEVAQECGFLDAYYFSRLFSRRVGKSPREYRNVGSQTSP